MSYSNSSFRVDQKTYQMHFGHHSAGCVAVEEVAFEPFYPAVDIADPVEGTAPASDIVPAWELGAAAAAVGGLPGQVVEPVLALEQTCSKDHCVLALGYWHHYCDIRWLIQGCPYQVSSPQRQVQEEWDDGPHQASFPY